MGFAFFAVLPKNQKIKTAYNSVGLINWLRQPGQIRNALKSL
jgi:hypothetical protein